MLILGHTYSSDPKARPHAEPFALDDTKRSRHVYISGQTGTGKSTTLKYFAFQDVSAGRGLAFFDPHGDDAQHLLHLIPKNRLEDVIYFDPSDIAYPLGFNPIERIEPDLRPNVVSAIVDGFQTAFHASWGPQLAITLELSAYVAMELPNPTLLTIPRLLSDTNYRTATLGRIKDRSIKAAWEAYIHDLDEKEQRRNSLSTLNKVLQFQTDYRLRNIFGQPRSGFSFKDILDTNKIFIANLSEGSLGVEKSRLLGALLLASFRTAALQRKTRDPFMLIADEFHKYGANVFPDMLSGIRKFGIQLVLANQYLAQLEPPLRSAVLGTVGTLLAFQPGPEDAETLTPYFRLTRNDTDLTDLPPYSAYVRSQGITTHLSMSPPTPKVHLALSKNIINRCRNKLARKRAHAEDIVAKLLA